MAAAVNCFVIDATGEAASGLTPYPFLNTTESPRATRTVPLNPALDTYDWTTCSIRTVFCANRTVAGARTRIQASSIRRIGTPDTLVESSLDKYLY